MDQVVINLLYTLKQKTKSFTRYHRLFLLLLLFLAFFAATSLILPVNVSSVKLLVLQFSFAYTAG